MPSTIAIANVVLNWYLLLRLYGLYQIILFLYMIVVLFFTTMFCMFKFLSKWSCKGIITKKSMCAGMCPLWVVVLRQGWYQYKMYYASHKLYTLAHHDVVTSIKYVQAIEINICRLWIWYSLPRSCNMYVHITENMFCDNFLRVTQTSKFIDISFSSC